MSGKGMQRFKLVVAAIIAIVIIIVIVQNTAAVDTRLLFVTVSMPGALLLVLTLAAGFVLGLVLSAAIMRRQKKEQSK